MMQSVIRRHYQMVKTHPVIAAIILLLLGLMTSEYIRNNTVIHGIGYLSAVYLGIFLMDYVSIAFPVDTKAFPIKKPLKKELVIILVCTLLGLAFVAIRYFSDWDKMNGLLKISVLPLIIFAFPIFLAVLYLLVYRYPVKDLGVNLNYWYMPILINIIFGTITLLVAPHNANWQLILHNGIIKMLFMSFITAALSEEFTRSLIQSRLGRYANNMAAGWLVAALIWSLMHFPIFSQEHLKTGWRAVIMATLNLIPLGLLWGYITYRSKSIIPSVFIHGLNFWGLQNF